MSEQSHSGSSGCGCISVILTILLLWTVFVGLPTPWGTYNIDLLWPAIRRTDEPNPEQRP